MIIIILQQFLKNIKCYWRTKKEIESYNYNDSINDYIQCIWYCISDDNLQENEITFIKEMKEKRISLPLILVYTKAEDTNKVIDFYNKVYFYISRDIILENHIEKILKKETVNGILFSIADGI